MVGIFDTPVLRIEQQSSQLDYLISDEGGMVVGRATQVAGPKPRGGIVGRFESGVTGARIVVQVAGPDGQPLFFVDHQDGSPVAIVAADGHVIGRFTGQIGNLTRMSDRMVDADDLPVCGLHWEIRTTRHENGIRSTPVGCSYADMHGQPIAEMGIREAAGFKDRYDLRLFYQLPEPRRTLIIASPLAFDLERT